MTETKELVRGGYRVMVGGEERGQIAARHWGDAAATIYFRFGDDRPWEPTPFQVADVWHSATSAALRVDAWLECEIGAGFFAEGEEFTLAGVVEI